jgi:hypothetical protein
MSINTMTMARHGGDLRDYLAADQAGTGFAELTSEDLREDRSLALSHNCGWVPTVTIECGTWVCACR